MASRIYSDDLLSDIFNIALYVVLRTLRFLYSALFYWPYWIWGLVLWRFGKEALFGAYVAILGGFCELAILRQCSPYAFVHHHVRATTLHGLARPIGYFLVTWLLIALGYIFFHMWQAEADEKKARHSLVLGRSLNSLRSVMLDDTKRPEHILALGSTGTGKTTSVIEPAMQYDIAKRRGLMFMTAKDDPAFIERVYSWAENCRRAGDVRIFTLSDSPRSDSYNPIFTTDAMALRDLCMESFTWDSPYYRDQARSALLYVLAALIETGKKFSLKDLYYVFTQKECLEILADMAITPKLKQHLQSYSEDWKQHRENNRGLAANLEDYTTDHLAPRVCAYSPDINLVEAYEKKQIVLFVLNSLQYGETARRLGRMIIQNLRYIAGKKAEAGNAPFYPVYIDEFHHFVFPEFFSVVAQCRSSNIGLMLSTQSFADFRGDGWDITQQVVQNTNTKVILRQNDSESAEHAARLGGTQTVVKRTKQIETSIFGTADTGLGSEHEVEEFVVHPNKIRSLQTGRAAIIREGRAEIVALNRAMAPLSQHKPDGRMPIMQGSQGGIDIYGRWKMAEREVGHGIRRPKVRKGAKGLDAIRRKMT